MLSKTAKIQNIINSGSGKNLSKLSALFDDTFPWDSDEHVRTHKVIEIDGDFLALSCANQRLHKEKIIFPYTKFTDKAVISKMAPEDQIKADQIRDYYSKKIMLWKLTDCKLSQFRQDLNTFIHGPKDSIREGFVGLVHRLPEIYDYDVEFDTLKQYANAGKIKYVSKNFQLKFKKKLLWKQRNFTRVEYFFTDQLDNLWCLPFDDKNQLLQVFDKTLNDVVSIYTTPSIRRCGEMSWYEAGKWELNE